MPLLPFLQRVETCERDGFPLVEIRGDLYCSVEYADTLIGGERVLGVAEGEDGQVELLMTGDHIIPLTCPCCGGAIHRKQRTLGEVRALLLGRTIEGFRQGEWVGTGSPPKRHAVFALQFSGSEDRGERTIEVSLESVRGIRPREHIITEASQTEA
ncbi:MAG TPA: hypothetical protein DEU95_07170 [Chloroflexi bacterium]|jgi:hypothetical protein|nr:hypothetical protein [Chloroflexota bacterium]HBY47595.1 hypothetical protein [Chloroflexota bacterium]HCG29514.1 hypothetical protein [Chloroflexota bacterium]